MEKITIVREKDFELDELGVMKSAGLIRLSNWIEIWFGPIYPIKDLDSAKEAAKLFVLSLNQYNAGTQMLNEINK